MIDGDTTLAVLVEIVRQRDIYRHALETILLGMDPSADDPFDLKKQIVDIGEYIEQTHAKAAPQPPLAGTRSPDVVRWSCALCNDCGVVPRSMSIPAAIRSDHGRTSPDCVFDTDRIRLSSVVL